MICCNNSYSEVLEETFKKGKQKTSKPKEYSKGKDKKQDYSKERQRKRNQGE